MEFRQNHHDQNNIAREMGSFISVNMSVFGQETKALEIGVRRAIFFFDKHHACTNMKYKCNLAD